MIAIDFGTTNSSIAVFPEGDSEPRVQMLEYGDADSMQANVMPSVVAECKNYDCKKQPLTFGHEGLRHYYGSKHDISLLQEMKLYYDRSTVEPATLVQTGENTVLRLEGGFLSTVRKPVRQAIYHGNVPLQPSEYVPGTAKLVRYLLSRTNANLEDRREIVFGVPASFKTAGKKRLREAGKRGAVGEGGTYENIHVYSEPMAAARAYMHLDAGRTLVLDYGGGTLDISVMALEKGGKFDASKIEFDGFSEGGSRMDDKLLEYCIDKGGHDLSDWYPKQDLLTRRRIKRNVESAKIRLSTSINEVVAFPGSPVPEVTLTHADLALAFAGITNRMVAKVTEVVMRGVGKMENIDFVVLSGGTSLNREIQDAVTSIFRHIPPERFVVPDAAKPADVETCLCAVAKGLALLRRDGFPAIDFGD
jgi:molecular chaperone DnaK (HSP70)